MKTAEFVSPKHPDKLCDRISDTILDLYLTNDENSRCAIETCGGHGIVMVTGEVTSTYRIKDSKIEGIVRDIADDLDLEVIVNIIEQSPEISRGVDTGGAGDQGIMIGYACRDNDEFVPQEYYLARKLNKKIYQDYPYDGKTQITLDDNKIRVVCSFQNAPAKELEKIVGEFFNDYPYEIISLHCNPAGDWSIGSFQADAGVTGRKLAVDNYGPRVPLGGGAFSGKDCTKVDRGAAYMARYIATDMLKKDLLNHEVKIELAYAIGYDQPLQATALINNKFKQDITGYDLSPQGIIKFLELKKPIFSETSKWGHMGSDFNWQ
tara:strand:- start:4552 stop:5514 length:963 start_codon:yes stop_codon:yes gene_type:complete